ncbi:hypothetical protein OKW35_003595 [Paraburkholderia sp. MM5477-R1]
MPNKAPIPLFVSRLHKRAPFQFAVVESFSNDARKCHGERALDSRRDDY